MDAGYLYKAWQSLQRRDHLDYSKLRQLLEATYLDREVGAVIEDAYFFTAELDAARSSAFHSALSFPPPTGPGLRVRLVANEALVESVKGIMARAKEGGVDAGYQGYRDLFASQAFAGYRVEDQRQVLKLMVLMKGAPNPPSEAMIEAHKTILALLEEMVSTYHEPADHELLGICHAVLGDEPAASVVFRAGLALERERDPQSKLCGTLMRRVSMV